MKTGIAGDFDSKISTPTSPAGRLLVQFQVSIKAKTADEGEETFEIVPESATGATIGDGLGKATILIN